MPTGTGDSIMRTFLAKGLARRLWSVEAFLTALLVCSVALNVYLTFKVKRYENVVSSLKGEGSLAVGSSVPSIEAKDLDGRTATLAFNGEGAPTVLYVFRPECGWCERNSQSVNALAAQAGDKYRFVGLSLSSKELKEYAARHGIKFPVYTDLPFSVTSAYKLSGTPQTIIVSPDGRVVRNWMGAYTGEFQHEVESFFGVSLPGLTAQAQ